MRNIDLGGEVVRLYGKLVKDSLRQMPFDASTRAKFEAWQRRARRVMMNALGEMPKEKVALQVRREPVETNDRYTLERLVYRTRPGLHASAYLLTPRGIERPAPAVLALHGHSSGGKDETIDPKSIYRGFGRTLAERGCVTLCPEQIGFGGRALPPGRVTYDVLTHGLNLVGHTLIGLRYWDLVRALDLLETLDTVDRRRIGVMGLSLGGEMTLFLAAGDRRVKAACICGYLTSFASTFLHAPHCTCGALRDLARDLEHADLAALIAPRPLFADSGTADTSFLTRETRKTVRELRRIYDLYKRPKDDLGLEVHPGAHEICGAKSIPWLVRQLSR